MLFTCMYMRNMLLHTFFGLGLASLRAVPHTRGGPGPIMMGPSRHVAWHGMAVRPISKPCCKHSPVSHSGATGWAVQDRTLRRRQWPTLHAHVHTNRGHAPACMRCRQRPWQATTWRWGCMWRGKGGGAASMQPPAPPRVLAGSGPRLLPCRPSNPPCARTHHALHALHALPCTTPHAP